MTQRGTIRSRAFQVLLLLVALLLVVLYLRGRTQRGPIESPPPPGPLARGEGTRVERIERLPGDPAQSGGDAAGAGARIVIEREDPLWRLQVPREDLASANTVGELLRALEELRIERLLTGGDLADFGLAPPRHTLILTLRGGRTRQVEVGDYTPGGLEVYARWTGLEGIAIVSRYLSTRFLESDLAPWREAELLPPRPAAIDSVTIESPGGRVRLRRLEHRRWQVLSPAGRDADGEACERATAAFWRFPFTAYVDDPSQWGDLGLDPPRAAWVVYRGPAVDTLLIGARLDGGRAVVQLRGRVPGITSDQPYELLAGGLAALEERRLFRGQARDQRLVVVVGEETGRAWLKRADHWEARDLTPAEMRVAAAGQPPDTTAGNWRVPRDPALAGDLLNLLGIRGESWTAPLPRPADPVRDAAPWTVHLWDYAGQHTWVLFYPDDATAARRWLGGGTVPAGEVPAFAGRAVGSAQPARPLSVRSPAVLLWQLRLLRPWPGEER